TAVPTSGVLNTNLGNAGLVLGTIALDPDRAKERFPDIVQNWRIDQAWGSAQIMGAVHDVSAGYYANTGTALAIGPCATATAGFSPLVGGTAAGTVNGSEVCGHPADKLGWAVGIGSRFNLYQGDYFQWQFTYAHGATRYVNHTQGGAISPTQFKGD